VRSPVALCITALISSSVCRLPFITASTSPARASATASAAAAWLCSVATMRRSARSAPASSAVARIFASGPTRTGRIRPSSAASIGPISETGSQGWTTAVTTGSSSAQASISRR
jgi:hypothetical protein